MTLSRALTVEEAQFTLERLNITDFFSIKTRLWSIKINKSFLPSAYSQSFLYSPLSNSFGPLESTLSRWKTKNVLCLCSIIIGKCSFLTITLGSHPLSSSSSSPAWRFLDSSLGCSSCVSMTLPLRGKVTTEFLGHFQFCITKKLFTDKIRILSQGLYNLKTNLIHRRVREYCRSLR